MRFFTLAATLFSLSSIAFAGTDSDGVFDGESGSTLLDYHPPITSPSGGEVYLAGSTQKVTWKQTLPSGVDLSEVAQTANLLLGYKLPNDITLHLNVTLVENIPLYTGPGEVSYTIPQDLETRTTYILALVGSSGNVSPEFTIVGKEGPPLNETLNEVEGAVRGVAGNKRRLSKQRL